MKTILKKIAVVFATVFAFAGCQEATIFPNIPLTLDPLVLANPIAMAASASGKRLYVINSNNEVLWFDTSFMIFDITDPVVPAPIVVISVANFSGQMILDEPRGFVYIPNRQSGSESETVDHVLRININEASPGFLTVELIDSGASPFGAFFNGVDLYVAAVQEAIRYNVDDFSGYTVTDLSVTTDEQREVNAEDTRELAISPSGANIFVTNEADNMLILNAAEFVGPTAPGRTDLGTEPVDYVVTGPLSTRGVAADATFLYVVNVSPPSLNIMTDAGLAPVSGPPAEIASGSLQVASIPLGNNPGEVVLDEANARAYVTNTGDDTVSVIDTNLQQEIGRISVSTTEETQTEADDDFAGDQPFGLTLVNLDGVNYLYVAHFQTNIISVINADTLTLLGNFP